MWFHIIGWFSTISAALLSLYMESSYHNGVLDLRFSRPAPEVERYIREHHTPEEAKLMIEINDRDRFRSDNWVIMLWSIIVLFLNLCTFIWLCHAPLSPEGTGFSAWDPMLVTLWPISVGLLCYELGKTA